MRSWFKALLISAVILASCIFFLPSLAKYALNSMAPWAMAQADLQQARFHISSFSWGKLSLDHIQFQLLQNHSTHISVNTPANSPENSTRVDLQNIDITYSAWGLISGELHQIVVDKAHIKIAAAIAEDSNSQSNTKNNTQNNTLVLTSLETLFQQLPLQQLIINELEVIHPQATVSTYAKLTQQQLIVTSQIDTAFLKYPLSHTLTVDHKGEISSSVVINKGTKKVTNKASAPIFNLQGQWSESTKSTLQLSLQQSADIQSWLDLLSTAEQKQALTAKTAIQAWNLELTLPASITSTKALLSQLSAQGMMQIQINDFNIRDLVENTTLIENADLTFSLQTDIDQQLPQQWLLTLNAFDISGAINSLAPLDFTLEQGLTNPITVGCSFTAESTTNNSTSNCTWQGDISQTLRANDLSHTSVLNINGELKQNSLQNSELISRQSLTLTTQQHNALWPKANNQSQGEIILQAQHVDNRWHWQLNLPFGFQNHSKYLEKISVADHHAQLTDLHWQLLPDWQIAGINGEITSSKALTVNIDQLQLEVKSSRSHVSHIALENAQVSCNLDWLKLQYSPQLRSQQALSQLPLECTWQLQNQQGNWQQWPIPAVNFNGNMTLSSLDFNQAKFNTRMRLTGLADNLDLTLLAQHDFNQQPQQSHYQQGSAQLYLNNLKLDWNQLGLANMETLTQMQLLAGSLSAQGWFQWQQYQADIFDENSLAWRWQPDVMLRIDDFAGIYQELTTWEDIDIQLALRRPYYQDFRIDSQISALSIHPGIEINNVLARSTTTIKADLSQALIVIEEVHSDVLGGRINVPLIRFDTSQDTNAFGIEVEGIDVAQLAALEAGAGIDASGRLDGVLPIILSPAGATVPAGSLYARPPGGIVQYQGQTAESLKSSDPSVNLAMQVLDDFRYHTLQTDVTYQPTGELNLGLKFQGHNPTFFDGQATHFNLNLDYNLLDLLASLRISNDIVQKLENKYQ